ncbi:MAG: hypothetical protein V1899_08405 [Planctomycetota bacterium]
MKRIGRVIFLVAFILPALCQASQPAPASGERLRRKEARRVREKIAQDYVGARRSAETLYLKALTEMAKWLITLNAQTDAKKVVTEIKSADSQSAGLADLEKLMSGLTTSNELNDQQRKDFEKRLNLARQQRDDKLLALARTCYEAGLLGYAYDLVWECLEINSDNAVARVAMGQVKVGNEWVSRYAATQLQQGNVYVSEVGWVPKTAAERIKAGEWGESGRAMSMADADKLHANRSTPWIIETENFTLKSTATRKQALAIAERLEAIRTLCFRQYLEFFLRGSKTKGAQLLFSAPDKKKLLVNYYGCKDDFIAVMQKFKTSPANKEVILNSAGIYSLFDHASFFYYDPIFEQQQMVIMQHEVTHQVLSEYARDGAVFPWLAEGAAESLEAAQLNHDGRLQLPRSDAHPNVIGAAKMLAQGVLPPLSPLLTMRHEIFHQEPYRRNNYLLSGALFRFLLDSNHGIYAADFLEMLYDSYRGKVGRLIDYIDLDDIALEKAFRGYLEAIGQK